MSEAGVLRDAEETEPAVTAPGLAPATPNVFTSPDLPLCKPLTFLSF